MQRMNYTAENFHRLKSYKIETFAIYSQFFRSDKIVYTDDFIRTGGL